MTDYVSPKNAPCVTISPCSYTPSETTYEISTAQFTTDMLSFQVGSIVTLMVDGVLFTGTGNPFVSSVVPNLPQPAATCYFPLFMEVNYGASFLIGLLVINTNKTVAMYTTMAGGAFTLNSTYVIDATVVSYSTV